ncbi:PIN domain-containing protein [Devosia sp. A369]
MTTRILIDTSIWLDLAKDYRLVPVLTAIEDLINAEAISLIVPQLVVEEFDRNKERVVADSKRSLASHFKRVMETVTQFGDEDTRASTVAQLHEIDHKVAMKGEVSQKAIASVEKLLASGPPVPVSDSAKLKAAERALAKVAPFHLAKNSVGDAVLLEVYAEAMATETDLEVDFVFVTANHRDFSQHNGDQRLPHPDLLPLFPEGRSRYSTDIVDVIKTIDSDMLEEYQFEHEWYDEPRRLSEILEEINRLERIIWYDRHTMRADRIEHGDIKVLPEGVYSRDPHKANEILDTIWEGALKATKRVEDEIGKENLGPWEDFEWGMLNGKMSALRWVIGGDWDDLST